MSLVVEPPYGHPTSGGRAFTSCTHRVIFSSPPHQLGASVWKKAARIKQIRQIGVDALAVDARPKSTPPILNTEIDMSDTSHTPYIYVHTKQRATKERTVVTFGIRHMFSCFFLQNKQSETTPYVKHCLIRRALCQTPSFEWWV